MTHDPFVHQFNAVHASEIISTLIAKLDRYVKSNNAEDAQQQLDLLNDNLTTWCESNNPPNLQQLTSVKMSINAILGEANSHKKDAFKVLLKHKKGNKAVSAYKST
jgi:hypothetical protein